MRDGWVETTLGEVIEIARKRVDPSKLDPNTELIHWSIPQLDLTGGPTLEHASKIGSHKFIVTTESIIYSLLNPRIPRFGKVMGGNNVVCSTEFAVLQPNSPINIDYLYVFVSSNNFKSQVLSLAKGTTKSRERIDNKEILRIKIGLPPLAEQKRIVDLLSSVNSYIEALQQQVDIARKSRNAVSHELLTQGGEGWVETRLGEVAELGKGGSWGQDEYSDGLIQAFCLRGTDLAELINRRIPEAPVRWIKVSELRKSGCSKDMVLIETSGSKCGRSIVLTEEILSKFDLPVIYSNFCRTLTIDTKKVTKDYIEIWFSYNYASGLIPSYRATSAMPNLDVKALLRVELIKVPPLTEQKRIVEIISSFDNQINALEQSINKSKSLRSALLSDLLSGNHAIPESYDKLIGAA